MEFTDETNKVYELIRQLQADVDEGSYYYSDAAASIIEKADAKDIDCVLDPLTEREKTVIKLRFGIHDGNRRTLEEVGIEFNVTRERVRQIEAKALHKIYKFSINNKSNTK